MLVTIRFSFVGLCVLSGVVAFVVFALRMGPKDGFWLALFPIVLLLQYRSRAKRCERLMDVLEVGEERT